MFLKSKVKTADADAENNACTVRVNVLEIRTAVCESVKRSTYRKLCETVYSSCFFLVDIFIGCEILDSCCDPYVKVRGNDVVNIAEAVLVSLDI